MDQIDMDSQRNKEKSFLKWFHHNNKYNSLINWEPQNH